MRVWYGGSASRGPVLTCNLALIGAQRGLLWLEKIQKKEKKKLPDLPCMSD